ncbi:MAG TPA: LysM peptidoglycan-binding domain-containing protein, partial [Patescibacteria group bacterium]|nr:LysM peptidoglycan-binding domain-containing protein [Patescibacteria group bacterium]
MDFLFKLSSELLILFLAAGVAALNWFYFSFAGAASFQDQSLASNYLAMHQQYNPKLYAKNSSIVTVISSNSFVPQAQAEDFLDNQGLASDESNPYDGGDLVIGDENGILAPNPDSVQSLIKKQIKIYQTQPGDTLQSIAQNFGISQQTIMWANKLTSQTIKPGWQLIILPTDGVLVQATNNDTLPDIAHRYNPQKYNTNAAVREQAANQLLQNIISYNALDGAEDITGGDLIIVPGGQIIAPPAPPAPPKTQPKGNSKSSIDNDINTVTSLGDGYDGVNHLFPKGYCTYY